MAGRPPKPTALKLLQGNPGRRPLPKGEPMPPAGCEKPPSLTKRAAVLWDRLAPLYIAQGVLTQMDQSAFGTLCELQVEFTRKAKAGQTSGTLAKTLMSYYVQFGGTPSGRARIHVEPKKPESKLERFTRGA